MNNMLTIKEVNLLTVETEAIAHQCNCFGVMGGGVAKVIREKYPEVYETDKQTKEACRDKLGTFSCVKTGDGKMVYNIYSQYRYGVDKRHTDYEAFYTGLTAVRGHLQTLGLKKVAIPYKIGCGKGGGNWNIIITMIGEIFKDSGIDVLLCKLET
jgi:O-acetyl-ADP-ribose deacetylase (regulator of RNase III)